MVNEKWFVQIKKPPTTNCLDTEKLSILSKWLQTSQLWRCRL